MNENASNLVKRVQQGDAEALAAFIELRRPQLMAYIQKNLGAALRRKVEPEDLFQDISSDCVKALENVEFHDRDPFNWLCQMAQRRIIDAHRFFFDAQKRDASREIGLAAGADKTGRDGLINMLVASITSPSAAFSRDQKEFHLQQAIAQLPEDHREAIRLRFVEGLPTREIAERMGKSHGSIRVILTRVLKKLEAMMRDQPQ